MSGETVAAAGAQPSGIVQSPMGPHCQWSAACLRPVAVRTWAQGILQALLRGLPAALKPLQLVPYRPQVPTEVSQPHLQAAAMGQHQASDRQEAPGQRDSMQPAVQIGG
jgi:hypothetical protein